MLIIKEQIMNLIQIHQLSYDGTVNYSHEDNICIVILLWYFIYTMILKCIPWYYYDTFI